MVDTKIHASVSGSDASEFDYMYASSSSSSSSSVTRDFATYQYVNAETILTSMYGEVPASRTGNSLGITFTEAFRYPRTNDGLGGCHLTPIRDDLELLQVQTVLETSGSTGQAGDLEWNFAWVGVSKDPMLTVQSSAGPGYGKRFCRAGSWKNLFDGSDLGGYETNVDMPSCPSESDCPGGCWLGAEAGRAEIINRYWYTDPINATCTPELCDGEPDNKDYYHRLQTKALMELSSLRLYDAHESQLQQAKGAIYLCTS